MLGMPPAKLGLVYLHTGLRRFLDAIGAARTRELFLLGRYIDTATALSWGLVNRVAPAAELARSRSNWRASWPATPRSRRPARKRATAALLDRDGELAEEVEEELIELRRRSPRRTCARGCARSPRTFPPLARGITVRRAA